MPFFSQANFMFILQLKVLGNSVQYTVLTFFLQVPLASSRYDRQGRAIIPTIFLGA